MSIFLFDSFKNSYNFNNSLVCLTKNMAAATNYWAYAEIPSLKYLTSTIAAQDLNAVPGKDAIESDHHISLHIFLPRTADAAVVKQVSAVKKFQVELTGLGCFENKDQDVLFVKVGVNAELLALHRMLVKVFDTKWPRDEYTPHVTLAFLKPGKAASYVKSIKFDKILVVDVTEVLFKEHGEKPEHAQRVKLAA